jgi:hypothetical protein
VDRSEQVSSFNAILILRDLHRVPDRQQRHVLAGRRHHKRGHTWRWHAWLLTILLGGTFIYGEAWEFGDLSSRAIVPATF